MTATLRVAAVQLELRAEPDLEHFATHVAAVVGQAAQAGAELVVLPELASTGLLASDPDAASLRVADVPAAYRRVFPPCVEPIADVLRELATTHGLTVLGGSHYRRAADGTLPEHRAARARGRPRRAAGQAPPHAAGAGDGHDPGRRGARRRGSVRPPSRSRSAPTSSSRRSAGTWPSTGSTWSSARR